MSAELAHQKTDKHLYVALHHKVRIRGYTLLRNLFVVLQATICDNLYFDTIMSGVHTTDSLFFGVLGISLYLCIEIDKKEQV